VFKTAKARLVFLVLLAFMIVPASKAHAQSADTSKTTTAAKGTEPAPTHPPVVVTTDDDDDDDSCVITGSDPEPPC
jgi:hypothetical protein